MRRNAMLVYKVCRRTGEGRLVSALIREPYLTQYRIAEPVTSPTETGDLPACVQAAVWVGLKRAWEEPSADVRSSVALLRQKGA
jgi:hypothetical protein